MADGANPLKSNYFFREVIVLKKILLFKYLPANIDAGLLALRIIAGTSIFLKHGIEKLFHFSETAALMASRHHFVAAIGLTGSVLCAAFADVICAALIVAGLATRWSALISLLNLLVAWVVVLQMPYFSNSPVGQATHGEMIVAYSAAMIMLVCAGGGKYSIDSFLDK